jgi:hypothetical protein
MSKEGHPPPPQPTNCPGVMYEHGFNFNTGEGELHIKIINSHQDKNISCVLDTRKMSEELLKMGSITLNEVQEISSLVIVNDVSEDIVSLDGLGNTRNEYEGMFDTKICDTGRFEICIRSKNSFSQGLEEIKMEEFISSLENSIVTVKNDPEAVQRVFWSGMEIMMPATFFLATLMTISYRIWKRQERRVQENQE